MPCDPEERIVLLTTAVQRIDLVVQTVDAHLYKVIGDQPMDLHLSGFAPGQPVTVQTVSPPGEGVWKAQAPFLTDNYGCVAIATQAPLAGNDRDMDALGHFWSPFQNRGDLNDRETQQFALDWNGLHVPRASSPKLLLARIAPSVTSYRTSAILVRSLHSRTETVSRSKTMSKPIPLLIVKYERGVGETHNEHRTVSLSCTH
jgi:hypothetical protein